MAAHVAQTDEGEGPSHDVIPLHEVRKNGLLGSSRAASTSSRSGRPAAPLRSAVRVAVAVVGVDGLLVGRAGVHPDGGDQHQVAHGAALDHALGDGVGHAARDARLGGAPGEVAVPAGADRRLVDEQRHGQHGEARLQHGDERHVALPRRRQGRRPGDAHRAPRADPARC